MIIAWVQDGTLCATYDPANVPDEYRNEAISFPNLSWPQDVERLVADGGSIREKSDDEIRQEKLLAALEQIRRERNRRLAETDWVVARAYERGEPVPAEWAAYRQALRDLSQRVTDEQALSGQIPWPEPPAG